MGLLDRAALPSPRFRELRYTFATLQLTRRHEPQDRLRGPWGHNEIGITLERYSHALPTTQAEAMGRLDAVLGRSPLDAPEPAAAQPKQTMLWLDEDREAWARPAPAGRRDQVRAR